MKNIRTHKGYLIVKGDSGWILTYQRVVVPSLRESLITGAPVKSWTEYELFPALAQAKRFVDNLIVEDFGS